MVAGGEPGQHRAVAFVGQDAFHDDVEAVVEGVLGDEVDQGDVRAAGGVALAKDGPFPG